MDLRPLEIFYFFQCGDRLNTSESDVCRRQILTYIDSPRTERDQRDSSLSIIVNCQAPNTMNDKGYISAGM